jgi:branched-chain amino acid transport system permease protein
MTLMFLGVTITLFQIYLLNVLMAYSAYLGLISGAFSFAYVAFIGVGAYTAGIMSAEHGRPWWQNIFVAMFFCAIAAIIMAGPLERVSGIYLAIASVALVGLFQVLLINLSGLTHGATGITNISLSMTTTKLVIAVIIFAILLRQLERSDVGRAIRMTRLDPIVAGSLGVNVRRLRVLLFIASAIAAGFAGAMRAHYFGYVGPDAYSFDLVITLLAIVIIGGIGSWIGPLVGAAIFTMLPEWLQGLGEWREFVTGALLLVIVIVTREGLVGAAKFGLYNLRRRREVGSAPGPPAAAAVGPQSDDL